MIISEGTLVVFDGDVSFNNDTEIIAYDDIIFKGDITIANGSSLFSPLSTGFVIFNNSAMQTISGAEPIFIPKLAFDNSGGFSLNQSINIGSKLVLLDGIIDNGENIVTLGSGIDSRGDLTHVSGHFSGKFKKWIEFDEGAKDGFIGSAVLFPVGDDGSYHPVEITFMEESPGGSLTAFFKPEAESTYISPAIYDGAQGINSIAEKGWWELEKGDGMKESGFAFDITAQISNITADNVSYEITNAAGLRLLRRDGPAEDWEIAGTFDEASYNELEDIVVISMEDVGNSFGQIALGADLNENPLPINLLGFWCECNIDHVKIYWETVSEINNWYFEVEKSENLYNWNLLEKIPGKGNTSQKNVYSVADYSKNNGSAYYRLKQVDFDGKEEVFNPVSLYCPQVASGLILHRLTAQNGIIEVWYSSNMPNITYQVYDVNGKLQFSNSRIGIPVNTITEAIENISDKGVYILRLSNDKETIVRKFISL